MVIISIETSRYRFQIIYEFTIQARNVDCSEFLFLEDNRIIHKLKLSEKLLSLRIKPGLHMVVTIAEHAYDNASKKILKLSTYRPQLSLLKDKYF